MINNALEFICFQEDFEEEMRKQGVRDPWAHHPTKREYFKDTMNGIPCTRLVIHEADEEDIRAWEKERDEYIERRERYIALRCLREISWESFEYMCKINQLNDLLEEHFPCEDPTSQCDLFCSKFALQGEGRDRK